MKKSNIKRTIIAASIVSLIVILLSAWVVFHMHYLVGIGCGYLDLSLVDFTAVLCAIFLVAEGFARMAQDRAAGMGVQALRIIRVGIGFSIITLHLIQFIQR